MNTRKTGPAFLSSVTEALPVRWLDQAIELEGVMGPARAALVADLRRQTGHPLLVVVAEEEDARELQRSLRFFLGREDDDPDFLGERLVAPLLPDELSPYESRKLTPSRARLMERLATLYSLSQPFRPPIVITTAWGLMRRTLPKRVLTTATEYILAGADIDRHDLLRNLAAGGYVTSPIVEDPGTFSARGGIIDVFSPLYSHPLRLEFLGDTLESLRLFDPATQKSRRHLEEAYIPPVREVVLEESIRRRGAEKIEKLARDQGSLDRRLMNALTDLREGLYTHELDPYLPLFYEEMAPLFAYLSADTRLVIDNPAAVDAALVQHFDRLRVQWEERDRDDDLLLPPEAYTLPPEDVAARRMHMGRVESYHLRFGVGGGEPAVQFAWDNHEELKQELSLRRGRAEVLEPLIRRFQNWVEQGYKVFLVANTEPQADRLRDLLEPHRLRLLRWDKPFPEVWRDVSDVHNDQVNLVVGPLRRGQIWPAEKAVFLCEEEIFGERKRRRAKTVSLDKEAFLTSLDDINEGDFIVHIEFGVGVYRGLEQLEAGGAVNDYLYIEYLAGDKLYLPVTRLDKVQKYSSAEGAIPQLDRMGGTRWLKLKARVKAAIREMAEELLKLYAARKITMGHAFSSPDSYFHEFEATFPYEETPDQERAIKEVLRDMQKPKAMDRLVCGDVGFGKTEVAIRAAMKAALDNKQVAVLVPTTVLALQHAETFTERFKDYPVVIDSISRFKTAKQQRESLKKLKEGKIDIIIGTHRILSKDMEFADLGLLVVDEEQRFGVAHKERIKAMRKNVDVLTLTATPIPRTLNMAFSGVRDISVIKTPPNDRLSIRTFISKFDEEVIGEAVAAELRRGGQVYFIHNRIGSIGAMATLIKRLVPQARVSVAHGQMSEHQLESVMLDFIQRRTNVLVSTTIIESGIDIPSVNTMIVNRADTFGLAQLYQLRGRVGRGKERAYAYLLVPSPDNLTKDAQKRLAALMRHTELGSGFRIATHDLEIRGAGNILGKQQSGQITAVGIDLYLELIEEAVRELKGEAARNQVEPQINLHLAAFLPNTYIPDTAQRLHFYKRLSSSASEEALLEIREEMEDRFGRPPVEAQHLVRAIELKILLRQINAEGIDLTPARMSVNLGEACVLDPDVAVGMVTRDPRRFRLTPDMKLACRFAGPELAEPIMAAKNILQELAGYANKNPHDFN